MIKEYKIKIVKDTERKFKDSSAIYFTKYTGMSVAQATELRKNFRDNEVEFKITKNTLTKIAAINAGYDKDKIENIFNGQIAIAYSYKDPTLPAKVIKNFKKDNEDCLEVIGLIFEGEFFEANKYKELADLPSKEELLTGLAISLKSPMNKMVNLLNSSMVQLVTALSGIEDNKN